MRSTEFPSTRPPARKSPTLSTEYAVGTPPLLALALVAEHAALRVLAIVDSGASRCVFPKGIAYALGISDAELVEDSTPMEGLETQMKTWSSLIAIRAQVLATFNGVTDPWGPLIDVNPAFIEADRFLLGRDDFFASFASISFVESRPMPVFVLNY